MFTFAVSHLHRYSVVTAAACTLSLHYDQRLPQSAAADMTDKLLIALQLSCC